MFKINFTVLIIFFTILGRVGLAQIGPVKYKEVAEIQKRALILALIEPSDKVTTEQAEKLNKAFIDAVKLQWTTHKDFEAKPASEVYKLYAARNKNYSVIKYDVIKVERRENNVILDTWNVGNIGFSLIENSFNEKPVYIMNQPITGKYPSDIDFQVAIKVFQNWMDYRNARINLLFQGRKIVAENAKTFNTKTLLLNKDFLDPKLTPEAIKEVFPYSFKIVENPEIEKAIVKKDPNYLFVFMAPMNVWQPQNLMQQVLDTQTLSMLGYDVKTITLQGASHGQVITSENLKSYLSFLKEK